MTSETQREPLPVALLACTVAVVLMAIVWSLGRPVDYFSEPLQLLDARLVSQGQQPHTAFYTLYPAFNYYLIAGLFALFGQTAVAERILYATLYVALVVASGWYFAAESTTRRGAALATLVAAALYIDSLQFPGFTGYAFAIGGLVVYVASLRQTGRGRWWMVLAAGVLTGLAAITKLNFAIYVGVAIAVDVGFAVAEERRVDPALALVTFAIPIALCVAAYVVPYLDHLDVLIGQLWKDPQRILYPIRILDFHTGANRFGTVLRTTLLLTPLLWTASRSRRFALPVLGVTALLLIAAAAIEQHHASRLIVLVVPILITIIAVQRLDRPFSRSELVVLVCMTMYLHYYLATADYAHFTFYASLIPFLLPFGTQARLACALALVLPLRTAVHVQPADLASGIALLNPGQWWDRHLTDAERVMRGPVPPLGPFKSLYADTNELHALQYVYARTTPHDAVFVGVTHNDRVYLNDIRAYWVLGRPVGTAYNMASLRLTTEDDVEQRIVGDLESRDVRWVVLWDEPPIGHFFAVPPYVGSPRLDEYLRERFQPAAQFGDFSVYARGNTLAR